MVIEYQTQQMGHSVGVQVGLSFGQVMFRTKRHFELVQFRLGELRLGSTHFFCPISLSCKKSNFVRNFGSGMVRFGSIRVSNPLSGETVLDVGQGISSGHSVRVSGLKLVLPGLLSINYKLFRLWLFIVQCTIFTHSFSLLVLTYNTGVRLLDFQALVP